MFSMQNQFKPNVEEERQVDRFIEDCIYVEEHTDKRGLPSLVVYIIFLEWCKHMAPECRLSFAEFNTVMSSQFEFTEFKDSVGVGGWKGVDLTHLAHLYLETSRMGAALSMWTERPDDEQSE